MLIKFSISLQRDGKSVAEINSLIVILEKYLISRITCSASPKVLLLDTSRVTKYISVNRNGWIVVFLTVSAQSRASFHTIKVTSTIERFGLEGTLKFI